MKSILFLKVQDKWRYWCSDTLKKERARITESNKTGGGAGSEWEPNVMETRILSVMGKNCISGISGATGDVGVQGNF